MQKGTPNFHPLRTALLEERWGDVPGYLTIEKAVKSWANGQFALENGRIKWGEHPLPRGLSDKIMGMLTKGEEPTSLLLFWERLQKNPSWRSTNQLWEFISHAGITVLKDGCLLAYKGVKTDYTDQHSGKVDNKPGTVNSMPRNQISDDPSVPCHYGFHVGDYSYAKNFAARVVVCKVDPADVVCVPNDESYRKMRVCTYRVIGNYGETLDTGAVSDEPLADVPVDDKKVEAVVKEEEAKVTRKDGKGRPVEEVVTAKSSQKVIPENPEGAALRKKYGKMKMEDLLLVPLADLRQYVTYGLLITGASKLAGGKPALVKMILEKR